MTALNGLVLAGGRSRRMGQDKALMVRDGRTQLAATMTLLEPLCDRVFVSVRDAQTTGDRAAWPQIVDQYGGLGPADGIVSAMSTDAESAWLVVACDLPRLDAATLTRLIGARAPDMDATAFRSSRDDLPEPLCAIYEPASREPMRGYLDDGVRCPRKMLLSMRTRLLPPAGGDTLANANTPEDWASITRLAGGTT